MGFGLDRSNGKLKIGPVRLPMPTSRAGRIAVGGVLMTCGLLGFMPVLGFWMLPLGFLVISNELHLARRLRRRVVVWWQRRRAVSGA
jgi:hypothetical protein